MNDQCSDDQILVVFAVSPSVLSLVALKTIRDTPSLLSVKQHFTVESDQTMEGQQALAYIVSKQGAVRFSCIVSMKFKS